MAVYGICISKEAPCASLRFVCLFSILRRLDYFHEKKERKIKRGTPKDCTPEKNEYENKSTYA